MDTKKILISISFLILFLLGFFIFYGSDSSLFSIPRYPAIVFLTILSSSLLIVESFLSNERHKLSASILNLLKFWSIGFAVSGIVTLLFMFLKINPDAISYFLFFDMIFFPIEFAMIALAWVISKIIPVEPKK